MCSALWRLDWRRRMESSMRLPKPVSIFTAGANPANTVRCTCAENPIQSGSPFSRNGSRMAEMPRIFRRGRIIETGSIKLSATAFFVFLTTTARAWIISTDLGTNSLWSSPNLITNLSIGLTHHITSRCN